MDLKFVDFPGLWQHFSIPAAELIDKNLYELGPEEAAKVKLMPGSLDQALDALEKDHEFLLRGDVFTKDVIETWLEYKRKAEVDAIRLRPHPWEFALVFRYLSGDTISFRRDN